MFGGGGFRRATLGKALQLGGDVVSLASSAINGTQKPDDDPRDDAERVCDDCWAARNGRAATPPPDRALATPTDDDVRYDVDVLRANDLVSANPSRGVYAELRLPDGRARPDRAEIVSCGPNFATYFKRTTRADQRCKNEQERCSRGRETGLES